MPSMALLSIYISYQPNPPTELLKLRLAADEGWLSLGHDLGFTAHVFRLGGIYGPGRSAIDTIIKKGALSDVQRGRSLKKYTSGVHVADICNALNESIHKPSPGRIYNIVDDDPAPRIEVFSYPHKLISEKWPSKIKKVASPATNELLTGEDEAVEKVVEFMDLYSINQEDLDSMMVMSKFQGHPNPLDGVQPSVKAALTKVANYV